MKTSPFTKNYPVKLTSFLNVKSKNNSIPKYIETIKRIKVDKVAKFWYNGEYRIVVIQIDDKDSIRGYQLNDHNNFKRFNKNKIVGGKINITEYVN